jgi:hypothetical protein
MMKRGILRTYDLNPDGVRIVVKWHEVQVGMSIFIPCINTNKAMEQVKKITAKWSWDVEVRVGAAGDRWGVRVWRIL